MPDFTCPRCGYKTSQICNYKSHLGKKKICEGSASLAEEYKKYKIDPTERVNRLFEIIDKEKQKIIEIKEKERVPYVIYTISCKDTNITDTYIGSTSNFNQRQYDHRRNTYNPGSKSYHLKLYETIRMNGGIDNWEFKVVDCDTYTKTEAETVEERKRVELECTLNSKVCKITHFKKY